MTVQTSYLQKNSGFKATFSTLKQPEPNFLRLALVCVLILRNKTQSKIRGSNP